MSRLAEIRSVEGYVMAKARYDGEFHDESIGPVKRIRRFWALYREALNCSNNGKTHYKYYYLRKANGNHRKIYAPFSTLKSHQRFIAALLSEATEVSESAFGYVRGKSIKQMATIHHESGNDIIIKLDIEGFFDAINFGRVYHIFRRYTCGNKALCTFLANMCTVQGRLAQGAPSSPIISNLVFRDIDEIIAGYCDSKNIIFTRYSDDMTFSFASDSISNSTDTTIKRTIGFVRRLLSSYGFKLNEDKIKVITKGGRYNVLGINIGGDRIRVPKVYKKDIRKVMHYIKKFGLENHIEHSEGFRLDEMGPEKKLQTYIDYLRKLEGKIQHVLYIEPDNTEMIGYKDVIKILLKEYRITLNPIKHIDGFIAISDDDIPF